MNIRGKSSFITVQTQGSILPADLLRRVAGGDGDLQGLKESDYHLVSDTFNEAISRSWSKLLSVWKVFRPQLDELPDTDAGTGVTRERWTLPLFQELGYGRLPISKAIEIEGKTYPISHHWENTPIHLLGINVDLNKPMPGVAGAARMSPHSLVQEYLNRSKGILWAFLCNGRKLRILRDNVSLTRQSYVEFDLQAMMDGEIYSDFALMWLLCQESRVEGESHNTCWLEKWSHAAQDQGVRALEQLRGGVKDAIEALGKGFLANPLNNTLREKLRNGTLAKGDYYWQVLRLVYRIIFLLAAEERGLLHKDNAPIEAVQRYVRFYSIGRMRGIAEKLRGSRHTDLYRTFAFVVGKINNDGCPELALEPLGGYLFSEEATTDLQDCYLSNRDFLSAVRNLSFVIYNNMRRHVDYRNLGSEELGSVYESLLELHPDIDMVAGKFSLGAVSGSERKTTGSYYTPTSLVQCLLGSALDTVLDVAMKSDNSEKAILNLKVCDPACGSGHFIVAAAHRITKRLATVRSNGEEPSPEIYSNTLRDVIGRCVYGVDVNEMAVELCKVNLWMEAMVPGKPLTFLDHHIKCGNSLLGGTPDLIAQGIPDAAFTVVEGDDKKANAVLKKRNKLERAKIGPLFAQQDSETQARLQQAAALLEELPDDRLEDIRAKEIALRSREQREDYRQKKRLADTWCAAFVINKHFREAGREISTSGITQGHLNDLAAGSPLSEDLAAEVERLTSQYQFFHWHLAFPEVFAKGGFDCVLGNPPWEASDLMKVEFFATLLPEVAAARTTDDRVAIIEQAVSHDPHLEVVWNNAQRHNSAQSHFIRTSNRYPLTSGGKLNTYRTFAELTTFLVSSSGRIGMILKSGIINAQDNQKFFASLLRDSRVVSAFDFVNTEQIFADVVANERFCLLTVTGVYGGVTAACFMFCLEDIEQTSDETRHVVFTADELSALNPNDLSVPPLTSAGDKELLVLIHKGIPVLVNERTETNLLRVRYARGHLNSSTDSSLFAKNVFESLATSELVDNSGRWNSEEVRPLIEGKLIGMWNHRFGTFLGVPWASRFGKKAQAKNPTLIELCDPYFRNVPRFWLHESDARRLIVAKGCALKWLLTYRHVCRAIVDARTAQVCISPNEPTSDSCALLLFDDMPERAATSACLLVAAWSSFVGDYVLRQKIYGPALTKAISRQLPAPTIHTLEARHPGTIDAQFVKTRALELSYTSWDLEPFAQDCGWSGPPFCWNEERRFILRCELDAAFFHLYLPVKADGQWKPAREAEGAVRNEPAEELEELKCHFPTPRAAAAYIMDTFPIVKRKDEEKYGGDYRTKRVILEIYDAMQEAIRNGQPYQTRLDPPPADPRVAHPPREHVLINEQNDFTEGDSPEVKSLPIGFHPAHQTLLDIIKPDQKPDIPESGKSIIHADKVSNDPDVWDQMHKWAKETGSINTYWVDFARTLAAKLKNRTSLTAKEKQDMEKCWKQAVKKGFPASFG